MAVSLTTGTAQTDNGAAPVPLYLDVPSDDYIEKSDRPGETIYTNANALLDQPNTVRFSVADVANVFTGNDQISSQNAGGVPTGGLSILYQVNECWKFDDAADEVAPLYYPASVHTVVRVPKHALVTSAVASSLVLRGLGAILRDADDTPAIGLARLLQGVTSW